MEFVAMIVAGCLGSVPGAIFGSIFIVFVNSLLGMPSNFFLGTGAVTAMVPVREFVYGAVIIFFITLEPKGIFSIWERAKTLFRNRPF